MTSGKFFLLHIVAIILAERRKAVAFLQSVTELRLKDRVIVSNLQRKLKAHPRAAVLSEKSPRRFTG